MMKGLIIVKEVRDYIKLSLINCFTQNNKQLMRIFLLNKSLNLKGNL